jgi:hypothetical protein
MFIITWLFDKLGYVPKTSIYTSTPVEITSLSSLKTNPRITKKPAVKRVSTRKTKAK